MSGETDDEFLSDEQIELRDLKAKFATMEQTQTHQEVNAGANALKEHLASFYVQYPVSMDTRKAVEAKFHRYIEGLSSQGDVGLNALRALQNRNTGLDTVQALGLNFMTPEQQEEGIQNRVNSRNGKLAGMATDGQSTGASQGDEMLPEFATTLEALQAAKRNPEILRSMYEPD